VDTNQVVEAIFEGLLLLERQGNQGLAQARLPGLEEYLRPQKEDLYGTWEASADRQKRSNTLFAQQSIRPEEVAAELSATRAAIGSSVEVATFVRDALRAHGATVSDLATLPVRVDPREAPQALRDAMGEARPFAARFELPVRDGERYLSRTDPLVEGLAGYVMDTALDAQADAVARRCGVLRTAAVRERTTLLLLRLRYHLVTQLPGGQQRQLLAEDCHVTAFTGAPGAARWLEDQDTEPLLAANAGGQRPTGRRQRLPGESGRRIRRPAAALGRAGRAPR
jgi:hypothetical protein